ncbi:MAG: hypothetical protein JWL69_1566 [Phycisphaerales bacterium]|nr:hypothetical protein [Phycisphaerales bacterium]
MLPSKSRSRRAEIRKNRPESESWDWQKLREDGVPASLGIAAAFFAVATCILILRQDVVPYRPGQWLSHDIVSRVSFRYSDPGRLESERRKASAREPRVYAANGDVWADVESGLLQLPERLTGTAEIPGELKPLLSDGAATKLRSYATPTARADYAKRVADYVEDLRKYRLSAGGQEWPIIVLDEDSRREDIRAKRPVRLTGTGTIDAPPTFTLKSDELHNILTAAAQNRFILALQPAVVDFTLSKLKPTHVLDDAATAEACTRASNDVPSSEGEVAFGPDQVLVRKLPAHALTQQEWQLLRAEHHKYIETLSGFKWKARLGVAGIVLAITAVLSAYLGFYQPRTVKNHPRALAIAALLLAMLLLNQIAAIGNGPLYLFGVAPTLLVAMIITIAYDQRTAIGISSMHGLLATIALNQSVPFFVILWVGVLTVCFLLDDIRTRSKLIEVGGAAALAMAFVAAAVGLLGFDPWDYIQQNCLYAGAAGLTVGFVVLGILPFVEKAFKITTSMTLLELADPSQPLLRRLAVEAPGTYNHSLQVGVIAEAAAEAIGANALLCRVASYYHDVGKINKPDYFVENQAGGESRHLNLTPNVSFLIITGHVKDGIELAKEYNLPSSIIPFIQQHHGTTLVEYFYRQACNQQEGRGGDGNEVKDHHYRYPGPRPRNREIAIVMLADCIESASRALAEPTANRVEGLVHELVMKRLLDGQLEECDLTMKDLEQIERTMMKTILGIYHGRIAYPETKRSDPAATIVDIRTA